VTQPRLADYLSHILTAIQRIGEYTADLDLEAFRTDALVQDAVIRNIEVLGEASHRIETSFPEFAMAHPELPISSAYQMRNAVAHGYFEVDLAIVWTTIKNDLPPLAVHVRDLLAD
jgi:uncharacterized protein with HEPN domain